MAKKILVTGSSGLIGSEAVEHFDGQGMKLWAWITTCAGNFLVWLGTRCGTWND